MEHSRAAHRSPVACAAVAAVEQNATYLPDDMQVSKAAAAIITYAIELAKTSETYSVHSWMLLLGILKYEQCTAAKTLRSLGLEDLYGAWNEVLWALHVSDGLEARPFIPEVGFADRAYKVLLASMRFADWGGRKKVQSEDLLMALAAGGVLQGLFPDLKMSFDSVRAAVQKEAGGVYVLPEDTDGKGGQQAADTEGIF